MEIVIIAVVLYALTQTSKTKSISGYQELGLEMPTIVYDASIRSRIEGRNKTVTQAQLFNTEDLIRPEVIDPQEAPQYGRQIKVVYTGSPVNPSAIQSSKQAYEIVIDLMGDQVDVQEHFIALFLTVANKVIGYYRHSVGTTNATMVDVPLLLGAALKAGAKGMILSHNHPSGTLRPSQADIDLTKKIKTVCSMIDITVLDHVIATRDGYYSFGDQGLM